MKRRLWKKSKIGAVSLALGTRRMAALAFILISLLFMAVSIVRPQLAQGVRVYTIDMFSPVLAFASKPIQDATAFARNVTGVAELRAENMALYQENLKLREWYHTALALESENSTLKDLLNVKLDPQYGFMTARVISDAGNAYVKSVLVSLGTRDGVIKGQAALSSDGLVGRIIEVGQDASRVLLVNDVNSRVPILVENTSHHGILVGDNSSKPLLEHLPPDFKGQTGTRVVTSGLGGMFPKGLPVGTLARDEHGRLFVDLYADMNRVVYIRVVDNAIDPHIRQGQLTP